MPVELSLREPADRTRINPGDPREFAYWCAALNVVPEQLRAAVGVAGVKTRDVRRYLGLSQADDDDN
ncbi:DUF3606 domain-containing protein [Bordetella sputigena]|uniref:DUF3606 domain-containing protein n=1 Tax=Bordetella sputigena TaxID=1416810 RepID=UPI0039EF2002